MQSTQSNLIQSEQFNSQMQRSQLPQSTMKESQLRQNDIQPINQENVPVAAPFTFLKIKSNEVFSLDQDFTSKISSILDTTVTTYISVLVENDSYEASSKLEKTLESISNSIKKLSETQSIQNNIIVCCFINHCSSDYFYENMSNVENKDILLRLWTYSSMNNETNSLNTLIITSQKYFKLTDAHIMTLFYNKIISFASENQIVNIINTTSGMTISPEHLCTLYKQMLLNSVIVPSVELENDVGIWNKIRQYEHIHYQIYDMNYFDMSGCVPIDHRFNVMKVDNKGLNAIRQFYCSMPTNAYIEHCDYALAIHLYHNAFTIQYDNSTKATITDNQDSYSDYMESYTKRHGGDISCTIELMKSLGNCNPCIPQHKVVLILQIIGMLFEFIQPSLTCMVAYTAFADGFNTSNTRPAVFLTAFLGILFILSGITSLVSKKPQDNHTMNFVFFIVFEVYYVFIIVVSICATHFINKKKPDPNEPYDFNKAAIATMIVLNFVFGMVPLVLGIKDRIGNAVNALLYLVMGASSSSTHFLMSYLHNLADFRGYETEPQRTKTIFVIVFYLANCLFGFLTLCNTTRKQRVVSVIVLASIFTAYNMLKHIIIVLRQLLLSKKTVNAMPAAQQKTTVNDQNNKLAEEKPINNFETKQETPNDYYTNDPNQYNYNKGNDDEMARTNGGFTSNGFNNGNYVTEDEEQRNAYETNDGRQNNNSGIFDNHDDHYVVGTNYNNKDIK
jgi:hypothetical protein